MAGIVYRAANEDDVESALAFMKGIAEYEKMSDEIEALQKLGATAHK